MNQFFERLLKNLLAVTSRFRICRSIQEAIVGQVMKQKYDVSHNNVNMTFIIPNKTSRFRAETFSTKEPETLEWIEGFSDRSILWDVGANVGLYSIYAAKNGHRVLAIEPSVFNLELLARNISINSVADRVTVLPIPLNNRSGISTMHIGNLDWGGSMSSFEKKVGWDGESFDPAITYDLMGFLH